MTTPFKTKSGLLIGSKYEPKQAPLYTSFDDDKIQESLLPTPVEYDFWETLTDYILQGISLFIGVMVLLMVFGLV